MEYSIKIINGKWTGNLLILDLFINLHRKPTPHRQKNNSYLKKYNYKFNFKNI